MKKTVSKTLAVVMSLTMLAGAATGCGSKSFDAKKNITIVSREDGSGTRGAFVELFGIEEKGYDLDRSSTGNFADQFCSDQDDTKRRKRSDRDS